MKRLILLTCLLLAGCNQNPTDEPRPAAQPQASASNPLPTLPPIVLEAPQSSLVDSILQNAYSRAQVSFATNAEGVECTLTSPDRADRQRVQEVVTRMFGSCKGTVDPPTVIFKLQPGPFYAQTISNLRSPPIRGDDTAARLQQRLAAERQIDLREIQDAQDDLSAAGRMIPGGNAAFNYSRNEIITAKQSHLNDLIQRYTTKYGSYP